MTDKLKALALTATPGPWEKAKLFEEANAAYIAAASPDAILALIKAKEDAEAKLERFQLIAKAAGGAAADFMRERDQLQAEIERLTEIVADRTKDVQHIQARVNAMESQEPVAYRQWIEPNPKLKGYWMLAQPEDKDRCLPQGKWEPLYLAPGAAPKDDDTVENMDEAYALACFKRGESNLARCFLKLYAAQAAPKEPAITDERGRPMTYWGGLAQAAPKEVTRRLVKSLQEAVNRFEMSEFQHHPVLAAWLTEARAAIDNAKQ